jgi:hypothetical protein
MTIEIKPLSPPRILFNETNPFNGDLFNRRELAKQLTGYLERLRDGTVIAIDAPWGEGKSCFGRNWAADLKSQDYRVIYLDAFQQDYVEDPFLLIASEINEVIITDDTAGEDLKKKAAKVMKAILPLTAKIALNVISRIALGTADASKGIDEAILAAEDDASEATQKWLEDKIESHSEEKKSLESFRDALQEFCESQVKPVVFFIDELDRCRPDFAVKLIERLKHFFDVPNLVFVLLLNHNQLEKAIKGVYGSETDSSAYLRKFIHMNLRLPKNEEASGDHSNANWNYLWQLSNHFKMIKSEPLDHFINSLSVFASIMKMSLRDMEKAMSLLALNGVGESAAYLPWLVALKLKYSDIFYGLLNDDVEAHLAAIKILEKMKSSENYYFWAKQYFLYLHISKAHGPNKLTEEQLTEFERLKPRNWTHMDQLKFWLKRLDIVVQN